MNSALVLLIALGAARDDSAKPVDDGFAVRRALGFLKATGTPFVKSKGCVTCHHSPMMTWAQQEAGQAGFDVDLDEVDATTETAIRKLLKAEKGYIGKQWTHTLASFYVLGQVDESRSERRKAVADPVQRLILEGQQKDGSWRAASQFKGQHRASDDAHDVQTMWSLLALSRLNASDEKIVAAKKRGLEWLRARDAGKTIDARVLRLLVERKFGSTEQTNPLLDELLALQHDDGGWGWRSDDPSDAWATGMVLYAGRVLDDERLAKKLAPARKFLKSTQRADGSWPVRSRLKKKGEDDQEAATIASFFGTVWAVIALSEAEQQAVAGP